MLFHLVSLALGSDRPQGTGNRKIRKRTKNKNPWPIAQKMVRGVSPERGRESIPWNGFVRHVGFRP